jgi:hypothetical protein
MKRIVILAIVSLLVAAPASAQKKKKRARAKPTAARKATAQPARPTSRMVGSPVEVVTKNGDRIAGELVDLNAYAIRIRAAGLESTVALDTISSVAFGPPPEPATGKPAPVASTLRADFARDASATLGAFQSVAASLQTGIDYTEFGRQITDLRGAVDRFVARYAGTENAAELRIISLVIACMTDYNWSRAIWTLKFGRSSDGTAYATESSALADALAAYPELKTGAAAGVNKYSVEKVIALLWKKASEKSARTRALVGSTN